MCFSLIFLLFMFLIHESGQIVDQQLQFLDAFKLKLNTIPMLSQFFTWYINEHITNFMTTQTWIKIYIKLFLYLFS